MNNVPHTQVGKNTDINKTVTWVVARLEEFGEAEIEAVGTGILTLCHIVCRFLKWKLPVEYEAKIGYLWEDERRIKPQLIVRLKAKEDYKKRVKNASFV